MHSNRTIVAAAALLATGCAKTAAGSPPRTPPAAPPGYAVVDAVPMETMKMPQRGIVGRGPAQPIPASAQKPRARDLGVPFEGTPGRFNAITDVDGVEVGHATIVRGSGELVIGEGPVRTGVTAVWPRGRDESDPVYAAWFTLNGNGEMTGTTWVRDSGIMEGPVMITNTLSVGVVHHAVIRWGGGAGHRAAAGRLARGAAGGRRDLGRDAQRHPGAARDRGGCDRGDGGGAWGGWWPRGTSGVGPA